MSHSMASASLLSRSLHRFHSFSDLVLKIQTGKELLTSFISDRVIRNIPDYKHVPRNRSMYRPNERRTKYAKSSTKYKVSTTIS